MSHMSAFAWDPMQHDTAGHGFAGFTLNNLVPNPSPDLAPLFVLLLFGVPLFSTKTKTYFFAGVLIPA